MQTFEKVDAVILSRADNLPSRDTAEVFRTYAHIAKKK